MVYVHWRVPLRVFFASGSEREGIKTAMVMQEKNLHGFQKRVRKSIHYEFARSSKVAKHLRLQILMNTSAAAVSAIWKGKFDGHVL